MFTDACTQHTLLRRAVITLCMLLAVHVVLVCVAFGKVSARPCAPETCAHQYVVGILGKVLIKTHSTLLITPTDPRGAYAELGNSSGREMAQQQHVNHVPKSLLSHLQCVARAKQTTTSHAYRHIKTTAAAKLCVRTTCRTDRFLAQESCCICERIVFTAFIVVKTHKTRTQNTDKQSQRNTRQSAQIKYNHS